jgi:hypothetical protein
MWNFPDGKIRDFRAWEDFLTHLTDAHILAAIAESLEVDSWKMLCKKLLESNWWKLCD